MRRDARLTMYRLAPLVLPAAATAAPRKWGWRLLIHRRMPVRATLAVATIVAFVASVGAPFKWY